MPEKIDPASNSLVPAEARSITQYSSEIVTRGLALANRLIVPKPIRVLIVDDIPEIRENIRRLLFFEDDIEVVGYAGNGVEAIEQYDALLPDIMTTCIHMPVMDGITATAEICRRHPSAKVIIATVCNPVDYARAAWSAGAKAFLVKPFSSDELCSAIREVAKGGVHPSTLVYDSESLKKYYAHSGIVIDALVDTLERLNARIVNGLSERDVRAFLRDMHNFEFGPSLAVCRREA